jgi:UrcA family protein
MTTNNRRLRNAVILAVGALASGVAFSAEPTPETQVTIRAERPTAKVVGRTSSGVPVQAYQLSYHVTFADLDITTPVGANALKARVRTAAYSLCQDLDKLYPTAEVDNTCARKAEDGAMSQVNTAITMAQAQGKTQAK